MLHGDTIITQGKAFDLLTGEPRTVENPITGAPIPWSFSRNYGCAHAIASEHLLTFRSAAAGFFDLANFGGTGNLGGFRSGCTSNLIAAGGVLNAPDYTRTCTCSYQNQASLGLVHMPELETWTFNRFALDGRRVRRLGINLGAPGDRRAPDGTLWLEYPLAGGPSPDLDVTLKPAQPGTFRVHSSAVQAAGPGWVAASGLRGLRQLAVPLVFEKGCEVSYAVRLHFVEPDDAGPAERVFGVRLQGRQVIARLDVAEAAGGRWRGIVREFRGVRVTRTLTVDLEPAGETRRGPVLCGLEVRAEDGRIKAF
jgi:hypothetical protein